MTDGRDVAARLRAVSGLRRLGARLPHVPTPAERARLVRFEELAKAPALATPDDVEALAAGWRAWWRAGRVEDIAAMAAAIPPALVDGDRRLATFAVAARAAR